MRSPAILLGAVAVMLGAGALIVAGGTILRSKAEISAEATAATGSGGAMADSGAIRPPITTERPAFKVGTERKSASRGVAPDEAGEASAEEDGLERVEPRAALSDIGQALPPKPKMPGEWKGTTLFQPVATAAGLIEAKGYRIAVAGIEPVRPEETCETAGKSWPCGMRARAAFRAWLRGRSITCEIPPQPDREIIVAPCQVGKQDVAEWLVESGWARAAGGSEYAALGETATQARKGIFGQPPPDQRARPVRRKQRTSRAPGFRHRDPVGAADGTRAGHRRSGPRAAAARARRAARRISYAASAPSRACAISARVSAMP